MDSDPPAGSIAGVDSGPCTAVLNAALSGKLPLLVPLLPAGGICTCCTGLLSPPSLAQQPAVQGQMFLIPSVWRASLAPSLQLAAQGCASGCPLSASGPTG